MAQDYDDGEESEESDEDQDDEEFERELNAKLDQAQEGTGGATRIAVSAERTEVPEDWKPPFYEKTNEQRRRLADAVSESFMFAALGYEQLQPVIDAFEEVKIEP